MRSLYHQGDSLLHRLPAPVKIAGLAAAATALFFTRDPAWLVAALLAGIALYASLGQRIAAAFARLRPILLTILLLGVFLLIFSSAEEALVTVLRLSTLMLLGAAVTASTSIQAFMETITRAAAPLERLGLLKAADIGLAVGLVLRFVPEVLARYEDIRDAHVARGLKPRASTLIGPLIISTLKDADNIAAAIDARGIRGQ
ncbi:energy-coupling factor transporter transmembrane protein EcfT [Rhizobium sp. RU36D]|uniref:energy-coupling factor transporter transmembrane component T family protein n=1 Tax=Rhizobium sp. RU36D TaxID=1907415 RepID=UPI0009D7C135|nr:energy-coupling factor transporter transmembrane protein EcfT [Rhizobium sp. RU36D]SMC91708.1 biotin transport system permease protein [Rhizobium sp. RU36D]